MPSPHKRERKVKLTPEQKAIILLADYLENPNHDSYNVKKHILKVLGLEEMTPTT